MLNKHYRTILVNQNTGMLKRVFKKAMLSLSFDVQVIRQKNCQTKRPDRDSNQQSQQVQLLLEVIVDKKAPCIMRVQYRGKCSVLWGCSVPWGIS